MKTLLLGATGAVGRHAAGELARSDDVERLLVASRDGSRSRWIAESLGGEARGVLPVVVEATDVRAVANAARDVDVVASCVGPAYLHESNVVNACIDGGVPYVSLCDDYPTTREVQGLSSHAERAGVTIVSGCGVSPGITNLLVALAAHELDDVQEVEIALAASAGDVHGAATDQHFLHMLAHEAPSITDHRHTALTAGTGPRRIYFPEPVGWVETFRSGHPEVVTLPDRHGGLRSLNFRIGLAERATMDAVRALVLGGLAKTEAARRRVLKLTAPIRPLLERLPPRGAAWTAARVDVRGLRSDRTVTISLGVVDHLVNLASVPLARAAILLGKGEAGTPGVRSAEDVFDTRPFLGHLARRGVRVARLEPYSP